VRHDRAVLIDSYLSSYDVIEHHETVVNAPSERAFEAVRDLDLARSPVIVALFAMRGLPLLARGRIRFSRRLTIDTLLQWGFVLLEEAPGSEIVLGIIGKFWRPDGGLRRIEGSEFAGFADPGYAKAAWNFRIADRGDGSCLVSTQTRIACTDDGARRRFHLYWRFVGPFSALTRRLILRAVKGDAERSSVR
jgi:hypothetical protein